MIHYRWTDRLKHSAAPFGNVTTIARMNVWRDRFQRWFGPLARRSPLSPNAITLLALAINVCGAVLLYRRQFLLAILLIAVGGLADLLDGLVARVQEKTSRFGDFLDHFC